MRRALRTIAFSLLLTTLTFHVLAREPLGGDGTPVLEKSLVLKPRTCTPFTFGLIRGHSYTVSLEPADSATACSATKGIRWTAEPYKRGRCIKSYWYNSKGCRILGSEGVQSGEELCSNWEDLNTTRLADNHGNCTKPIKSSAFIVSSHNLHYIAMMSMSNKRQKVKIVISVETESSNSSGTSRTYPSGYKGHQSSKTPSSLITLLAGLPASFLVLFFVTYCVVNRPHHRNNDNADSVTELPQDPHVESLPHQDTEDAVGQPEQCNEDIREYILKI